MSSSESETEIETDDTYRPAYLDYRWTPVKCYMPLIKEIKEEGDNWLVFDGTSRFYEECLPFDVVLHRYDKYLHIRITGYHYGEDTSEYGYDEELGNVCFFPTAIQRIEWSLLRDIPTRDEAYAIGTECISAYEEKRRHLNSLS